MEDWLKALLLVLGGGAGGGATAGLLKLLDWWRSKRKDDIRLAAAADRTAFARLNEYCDRLLGQMGEQAELIDRQRVHITDCEADYAGQYAWGEGMRAWGLRVRACLLRHGDDPGEVPDLPPRRDPRAASAEDFDRRQARQGTKLLREVDSKVIRPEKGHEDSASR